MKLRWMQGGWILLLCLFVFVALFCSGCWDRKELNQLALAQTIAIDYTDRQYQVTLQLILPSAEQETVTSENLWSMSGSGASVGDAIQQIALAAPRELYLDHLDLVLLGEGVLQHDVTQALEYLLNENVLHRRTSLLAVQGNAGVLLSESISIAEMDIFYMENLLKDQRRRLHGNDALVNAYYLATYSDIQETLVIPQIKLTEGTQLSLDGAALIAQGKLVSWGDRQWLLGYYWLVGGKEILTVSYEEKQIIAEATIKKCSWKIVSTEPLHVKGTLHIVFDIVSGYDCLEQQKNAEQMKASIQKQLEEIALQQTDSTLLQAQQQGTEAFHLGQWLYAWHPELVQVENWTEQFSALPITIELDTQITAK